MDPVPRAHPQVTQLIRNSEAHRPHLCPKPVATGLEVRQAVNKREVSQAESPRKETGMEVGTQDVCTHPWQAMEGRKEEEAGAGRGRS